MKVATEILGILESKLSKARDKLNQAQTNLDAAQEAQDKADWALINRLGSKISDAEYDALDKACIDAQVKVILCKEEFNRAQGSFDAYDSAVFEIEKIIRGHELSERLKKMTAEEWFADTEQFLAQVVKSA